MEIEELKSVYLDVKKGVLKVNKRQKEMYEIKTWEKRFINQKASSVLVSFELLGHDWCELSRSPEWKQVEKFLSQKKRNQNM